VNAIVKREPPQPPASDVGALMAIIDRAATDPNFDPARLMQLLEVKERWEATEARKAFTVAMAAFKADPPKIVKNKHVSFTTSKGTTAYDHATHSEVTEKIAAGLGQYGLSHRWNVEQSDGRIRVTCIITHSLGHAEQVAMTAAADDSGSKNSIQAIGSTVTYLQRYTLLASTGLTTAEMDRADDDGKGGGEPETIGPGQLKELEKILGEVKADKAKFLAYLKVDSLDKILVGSYAAAKSALESKRNK
jgi:hypothetical protein